jgi:tRNA U55 pseudouridine synthase TruB
MAELVRIAIGSFRVEEACTVRELNRHTLGNHLLPALRAVEDTLPIIHLAAAEVNRLSHGLTVACLGKLPPGIAVDQELAALDPQGQLAAIVRLGPDGSLAPKINFTTAG